MASVFLFRRKAQRINAEKFSKLASHLGVKGKPLQTDEAVLLKDDLRTLAYAGPCAKFAGLLFYADQTTAWGECTEKLVPDKRARDWAMNLLEKFDLLPQESTDDKIRVDFELTSSQTEAVVFDGKQRRRMKAKTDVASSISVNGIPVVGARGKVRMIFKAQERPSMIHVGLWEALSVHEERELVREHDVVRAVRDRLDQRTKCQDKAYDVRDVRLVYFADEYGGGPDLLAPSYFIELEFRDPRYSGKLPIQGPRQVVRVPAYR
jgi:hypothetical protein